MTDTDVRRIFTFVLGREPELLFVSGADTDDTFVKGMVKNLCADRAEGLAREGGFFIFTRTMTERGLFRAIIAAPDGTKVARLQNNIGTNTLDIRVDALAALASCVIYNLPFTEMEMVEFFTQALASVVAEYVPESLSAAQADAKNADPEPEPDPEPMQCRECDPDIKALCKQVRGETIN